MASLSLDLSRFDNPLLFGHSPTPHLVAVEPEGESAVRLFRREGEDLSSEILPFRPFLLVAQEQLLKGWRGECQVEALWGKGFYRYLVFVPSFAAQEHLKAYLQRKTGKTPNAPDAPYLSFNDPVHQYLLLSGQTLFHKLVLGDLRRLQFDIETYCAEGYSFSNPRRRSDRIVAIALSDSSGWERVIDGQQLSEKEMLLEFVRIVRERDPDVLEGHNIFRFDLEYLETRASQLGVRLALGRDGSPLHGHASRLQIAERSIAYRRYDVFGRHIMDTWILAQLYDIANRDLESYNLKDIARQFGLAQDHRTYLPPEKISWFFDHQPETLLDYALDDVRETRALSEMLSPAYFVQAQIFPYSYQNIVLRGNATKINSLFLRAYLHERHAIPHPGEAKEVLGGYTNIFFQGVARPVLHVDVASLYPSIMLAYECFSRSDELGVFPKLLRDLRSFRLKAKEMLHQAQSDEERHYLQALQGTFKILINSFYGYLGFSRGHFNDFDQANRVTALGREIVQDIVRRLQQAGCRVIEVDTDGIYFVPPPEVKGLEAEEDFLEHLTSDLPSGISLELAGRYQAMLSYKMKNYALLDEQGKLIVKGSGFRSRGLELFQRQWMEEMFRLLLSGEKAKIPALYQKYLEDFDHHRIPLAHFTKTETLQDSLEAYRDKVRGKKRNPAAAYELALRSERPYQPGDQVSYYVTGTSARVRVHESCKMASQWQPQNPDENTAYYKAKLQDLYHKFRPLIEADDEKEP